jgi:hypothetical protein
VAGILQDPSRAPVERIEATSGRIPLLGAELTGQRSELIRREIGELDEQIKRATTERSLGELKAKVDVLSRSDPGVWRDRVDALRRGLEQKAEDLLFDRVMAAKQDDPIFRSLAGRFLDEFGGSRPRADQVREKIDAWKQTKKREHRDRIRALPVSSPASLRGRGEAILEYLTAGHTDDAAEVSRMRRAAELALRFSQPAHYRVSLKHSGGLLGARHQKVRLVSGSDVLLDLWSIQEARSLSWGEVGGSTLTIPWQAGVPLRVELVGAHFITGKSTIGSVEDRTPSALRLLGTKQLLNVASNWSDDVQSPFIQFEVEGIGPEDWQAVSDYISPGDRL